MSLTTALQGKKTYALSALAIVATLAGVYTKQISPADAIVAIAGACGLSTMRQGSKNDAAAVINHVTDIASIAAAGASIVAREAPDSKAAATIGAVAGEIAEAGAAAVPVT